MSREAWLEERRKQYDGKVYGNITVIGYSHTVGKHTYFQCKCGLCGNVFTTRIDGVKNGHTNSCGCATEEWMHSGKLNRKHGLTNDRAYWVWAKVKSRCYNPNCREYKNYGGRGIKMCDEWLDPEKFIKWCYESGYDATAPKGQCTLDRKDVNGNYEPSNCTWITNQEQRNNRRNNVVVEYNGVKHTATEWARILNIPPTTMLAGLHNGKTIEYYLNDYVPRKKRN